MSIRDVEPIGWTWDYTANGWREVFADDDFDDHAPDDEEEEPAEDWRESCLTARERN
jgi:hypothetical protein